ncbi:MAG: BamA/TamA family outer membrane protein [Rickettsiales bacterium]
MATFSLQKALMLMPLAALCCNQLMAQTPATAPAVSALANDSQMTALETTEQEEDFFTGDDGRFDVSGFLDQAYGFLPMVMPITEPAIGYGLAGGVMFISDPLGEATEIDRPNITIVGGMATENGTEGLAVADIRYWAEGRLQTMVGYFDASINLDFYGIGDNERLANNPLQYNLDPQTGLVRGKYRIGNTAAWLGLGYVYANVDVSFDGVSDLERLPPFENNTVIAGLLPSISYDSRDNVFTPKTGSYLEMSAGWFNSDFGSDEDFKRATLIGIHYLPFAQDWFLGVRFDATASFDDTPFYLRPYVSLRGVPAMRKQGDDVAQLEAELRWQFWNRFSLIGFAGVGQTWTEQENEFFEKDDDRDVITAGGVGFRYEIARKYGIHMGMDFAVSEEDKAIYIQVGSAWGRP